MFYIRVDFNGYHFFVAENNPYHNKGIYYMDNIIHGWRFSSDKATLYHDKYEFLLAMRLLGEIKKDTEYDLKKDYHKNMSLYGLAEKKAEFYLVHKDDIYGKGEKIDLNEIVRFDKREIYIYNEAFNKLKKCFYDSSHWLYIDNEWIAFPKDENYNKINKIKYYKRGLTSFIETAFAYRNNLPACYNFFTGREFMTYGEFAKIALDDTIDECDVFYVYAK